MSDWTGGLPISEADVRAYLNADGTSGSYATALIGSNIRVESVTLGDGATQQINNRVVLTGTVLSSDDRDRAMPHRLEYELGHVVEFCCKLRDCLRRADAELMKLPARAQCDQTKGGAGVWVVTF